MKKIAMVVALGIVLSFAASCAPWYKGYGMATEQDLKDEANIPKMVQAAKEGSVDAMIALRRLGPGGLSELIAIAKEVPDVVPLLKELGRSESPKAMPVVVTRLASDDDEVVHVALWALKMIAERNPKVVTPGVLRVLNDTYENGPSRDTRWAAYELRRKFSFQKVADEQASPSE
jgi:hypothetical protein